MTREEAIEILKDGRENLYGALDKSVPYEQQHTLVALDIAIKSLEAWEKVKEEIKFIQEAEEQVYGKASWGFSRKCLDVLDKHLAEVNE